jgi:hypothetical protein
VRRAYRLAVGTIRGSMTSRYQEQLLQHLSPAPLRQRIPAAQLAQLDNPQLLLSPDAAARVRQEFAAFGPSGIDLLRQLMMAVRASLAEAFARGFLAGMLLIGIGFCATLFLREIPLS